MEDTVVHIVDLEERLKRELKKLAEAADLISKLPDPRWQRVITKRYLNNMQWDEIAPDMVECPRQIYRYHKKALAYIDTLLADD